MRSKPLKILTLVFLALILCTICTSCATEELSKSEIAQIIRETESGQIVVSFPGLGINPVVINKIAFSIPLGGANSITVYWYGVLIVIGIVLAVLYAWYRSKHNEGIKTDDLFDITLWAFVAAIVGARLYFVLTSLDKFQSFWDVFKLWDGGIAIYGALIGGAIAIYFVCRYKKLSFLKVVDMAAPAVMIGQIIGRWGNFINGEAYGYEVSQKSMLYFLRMGLYPHENEAIDVANNALAYVHPTFLYESVWNLVGFLLINLAYRKKKFDGQIFYMYIAWYGFGRMFIELLRTDSLYIGTIRISVLVGALCFVAGVGLLLLGLDKAKKISLAKQKYEKVYTNFNTGTPLTGQYAEEDSDKNGSEASEAEEPEESEENGDENN